MAASEQQPRLERVGKATAKQWPTLVALLGAGFVILALLKPWSPATTPHNPSQLPVARQEPATPAAAPPAQDPSLVAALGRRQCQSGAGWRVVAMERDALGPARALWDVGELAPSANAAIAQAHQLRDQEVRGIGFCAPGDERAARVARAATVSLWRRDPSGAIVPVSGARVIDPELAGEGEVYLAPPAPLAADGAWPAGDYFFEIGQAVAGSHATWLALEVLAEPGSSPAPRTPGPSPLSPAATNGKSTI